MNTLRNYYYRLLTLSHYLKKWGLKGLSIYSMIRNKEKGTTEVRLPEYNDSVYVRNTTSDVYSFEHVLAHECYRIPQTPADSRWIIDCGANVGYSAFYFAKSYPAATVIAIEPDSSNVEMIHKNCTNLTNVKIIKSAIWKSNAHLKITNKAASNWAFIVEETTPTDPDGFAAMSLQQIITDYQIPRIDVLKIDIEGSEYELLLENYDYWMSITKLLIIELHERLRSGCTDVFNAAIAHYPHERFASGENEVIVFKH